MFNPEPNSLFQIRPHVGILPLGTGNDLARVLGWGPGYSDDDDISELLKEYEHATPSLLDRLVGVFFLLIID